jgi:hypothetical protein
VLRRADQLLAAERIRLAPGWLATGWASSTGSEARSPTCRSRIRRPAQGLAAVDRERHLVDGDSLQLPPSGRTERSWTWREGTLKEDSVRDSSKVLRGSKAARAAL